MNDDARLPTGPTHLLTVNNLNRDINNIRQHSKSFITINETKETLLCIIYYLETEKVVANAI